MEKIDSNTDRRVVSDLNSKSNKDGNTPQLASVPLSPIGSEIGNVGIPKPGTAIINIQTEPSRLDGQALELRKTGPPGFRNQLP